jgi:hypothetical protein
MVWSLESPRLFDEPRTEVLGAVEHPWTSPAGGSLLERCFGIALRHESPPCSPLNTLQHPKLRPSTHRSFWLGSLSVGGSLVVGSYAPSSRTMPSTHRSFWLGSLSVGGSFVVGSYAPSSRTMPSTHRALSSGTLGFWIFLIVGFLLLLWLGLLRLALLLCLGLASLPGLAG